ncbi:hypothetical protein BC941DRAFT_415586 [Chlamydoabsidia padenii]|nr:hypothetical protein BC941DRAFT_415586 [Chlamydoabsidia padenii]
MKEVDRMGWSFHFPTFFAVVHFIHPFIYPSIHRRSPYIRPLSFCDSDIIILFSIFTILLRSKGSRKKEQF